MARIYWSQLRWRKSSDLLAVNKETSEATDLLFQQVNWRPVASAARVYVLLWPANGSQLRCDCCRHRDTVPKLNETPGSLGAAKHWSQFHFRGPQAFGDAGSLTGRYFIAEEARAADLVSRLAYTK